MRCKEENNQKQQLQTQRHRKDTQQMEAADYQYLVGKLKEVLATINSEKQAMQFRLEKQKQIAVKQLREKDSIIQRLNEENSLIKREMKNLCYEMDQKRSLIDYLKKKHSKLQLEKDSLTNIVHYLQEKNKELGQQIYQIKKSRTKLQQTGTKSSFLANLMSKPPNYVLNNLDKESVFEYTDFLEKDFIPTDLLKTESAPNPQKLIKSQEESSERTTVQRIGRPKEQNPGSSTQLQKVRSMGQLIDKDRTSLKLIPQQKKRESISKSQLANLTKISKNYIKSRRESKQSNPCFKSDVNLIKYYKG